MYDYKKNRKFVIDAITNTFDIDPNKMYIVKERGWSYILFERENREYEICHFSEDSKKIIIHLVWSGFENAGLGEISKESAKVVENDIKEKSGTNKEIDVSLEGLLDELGCDAEKSFDLEKITLKKHLRP